MIAKVFMEISEYIFRILDLFATVGVGIIIYRATNNGPSRAVQDQKDREERENKRKKKLDVFSTLMATRSNRLSDRHIEALNMIDIVYNDLNDDEVVYAWSEYYDILNKQPQIHNTQNNSQQWRDECDKLFVSLLYQIAISLGYDYTKLDIKNRCYSPVDQYHRDLDEREIRLGFADILSDRKPLQVHITSVALPSTNQPPGSSSELPTAKQKNET